MKYIKGEDRRQYVLFPACLDEYIEQDNPVRYINAFVDSLDLEELGFNRKYLLPLHSETSLNELVNGC